MTAAITGRRVLVTGLAGDLAGLVAARLAEHPQVEAVVGAGLRAPRHDASVTLIRADLRSPTLVGVLQRHRIDTLVHLALTAVPAHAGGRARMKERNVIGTMQLLAAAQKLAGLRSVVVKSTTAVYGSSSADPALLREDVDSGASPPSGYAKDAVDVESAVRAFARRRSDVAVSILRFANFIGPSMDTMFSRYLALPVVPTILGYDPRVQLCHETDVVEVVCRAATQDLPGTFNVAGPGIVYLSQAIRLAGRPTVPVPLPFVDVLAAGLRRSGRIDVSHEQLSFLLYGRVGDLSRLRESFGYEPRFSTRAALEDAIDHGRITPLVGRETAQRWERALHGLLRGTQPSSLAADHRPRAEQSRGTP